MAKRVYGKSVASYSAWAAETEYSLEDYRVPTTDNGMRYECTTAGISGETEPVWDKGLGSTTSDGTVVWTCREKEASPAPLSVEIDTRGLGGAPLRDIWVKSDSEEEAPFIVYGSHDGVNWRQIDEFSVPHGERDNRHKGLQTAYLFIKVSTETSANNEIEIVAGE